MTYDYAARVGRVEPSATLAIGNRAAELEAEGADIVDLSVGEPDFDTPENIVEAGKAALDAGHTGYPPSNGIPELREAISDAFAADGLAYAPEEIVVTPGAKQALYEVIMTLIDEGDEVVLLDPAWVSYEAMVKLAGGDLSRVDLAPHDFQLEPALDALRETVSAATELLVVNSPSNPSGAMFSGAALDGIRELAVEHDITVIADEIYKQIRYAESYTSLGTLDGMADRTITVNGFSKAYSMTGWRLGYFGASSELVDQAGKIHSHSVSSAANFVQRAGVEALKNTDDSVTDMVSAFEARRDLLADLLADTGITINRPDGAFYMMVPVDADDVAWCERAIDDAHVATVPGSAFGTPGYARFSYANSQDRLQEAITRLTDADLL